jgi:hypothetical protein
MERRTGVARCYQAVEAPSAGWNSCCIDCEPWWRINAVTISETTVNGALNNHHPAEVPFDPLNSYRCYMVPSSAPALRPPST